MANAQITHTKAMPLAKEDHTTHHIQSFRPHQQLGNGFSMNRQPLLEHLIPEDNSPPNSKSPTLRTFLGKLSTTFGVTQHAGDRSLLVSS